MISKIKLIDFAERVGATFVAGFAGVALVTGVGDPKALEAAAVAGGVSALKFFAVEANAFLKRQP